MKLKSSVAKRNQRKSGFQILLAAVLALMINVHPASAKWDDKSGDLPGTSDSNTGLIAVGAGVVVGVVVTAIIVKSVKKKNLATEEEQAFNLNDAAPKLSFYEEMKKEAEASPVELFVDMPKLQSSYNLNQQVAVGLRFKF